MGKEIKVLHKVNWFITVDETGQWELSIIQATVIKYKITCIK
jgi:hypothetical protein